MMISDSGLLFWATLYNLTKQKALYTVSQKTRHYSCR